jgi:hypothetical protein
VHPYAVDNLKVWLVWAVQTCRALLPLQRTGLGAPAWGPAYQGNNLGSTGS